MSSLGDESTTLHDAPVGIPGAIKRPRIALAHDWLVGARGGEAVLEAIARVALRVGSISSLYTMFDDGRPLSPVVDSIPHRTSVLNRLPGGAGSARRWLLPAYPIAVRQLSLALARDHAREPIDLLISTSSAAIKGLRPPPGVPHLCYCHAPMRYLWSQTSAYRSGEGGRARGLGLALFGPSLRAWDERTAERVTTFLANSRYTSREIERCFKRSSSVVFPPVRTEFFTPADGRAPTSRDGSWLYVGALEPYKRVDVAIMSANAHRQTLTIVGTGSHLTSLRSLAGPTITFAGRVDDLALRDHYRRASVLLFPQIEDFGIVAVEAQACGLPVVAFARGGALDTVLHSVTGVLVDDANPESLARGAFRAVAMGNVSAACRANAVRFAEDRFEKEIAGWISTSIGTAAR